MSARKLTVGGVIGGLLGFVGMSVVAGLLVTAAVTPAVAVTGIAAKDSLGVFEGLPEYLKIDSLDTRSTMYAQKGGQNVAIATFYSQNRIEDSWNQVSPMLKDAAVSTEDPRFYEHGAIDLQGTLRAAIADVTHKSSETQGGSSITQQYVKNVRVQTCEKYNVNVPTTTGETQKQIDAAQAAMDTKYADCYKSYTVQTPSRKIQEMKLAIGVEKKYSKQQILLGYLNIAGFGGQIYGVESAARYYFGVDADKVNLQQAATLIAILNNPANLRIDLTDAQSKTNGPKAGYADTLSRRNYVLRSMLKAKTITQAQYTAAVATKIEPHITPQPSGCASAAQYDAAFYCQAVLNIMQQDPAFGKTQTDRDSLLRHGGLQIYTPLNLDLQQVAQSSLSTWVPAQRSDINIGAVNVAMELNTGRVVDMVQNRPYTSIGSATDQSHTSINYAVDYSLGGSIGFQTGSTYKAFSLLEWLKEGHSLNDIVNAPVSKASYPASAFHSTCNLAGDGTSGLAAWPNVGNDEVGEGGPMSVLTATAQSINTAFSQMATQLDLCGIRQNAEDLGVHLAYPYDLSSGKPVGLAGNPATILGTNNIAPVTMAAAYAGIANSGVYCNPIYIDKVLDASGKSLSVPKPDCKQTIDKNLAAGAIYALKTPLQSSLNGTAVLANPNDGVPLIAKTGTTDFAQQNWLVSSSTKVAQATWVGNVQGTVGFGGLSFNGGIDNGRNVKLFVAKPIIQKLDQMYGGSQFPQPTKSELQSKQVTLPDLSGKSVATAKSILTSLGLGYTDGKSQASAYPKGSVASTSPAAGDKATVGMPVTVYTSDASEVFVPDVTGHSVLYAQQTLTAAGLSVNVWGSPQQTVTSQTPAAHAQVKPGTHVTLSVDPTKAPAPTATASPPSKGGQQGAPTGTGTGDNGTWPGFPAPPGEPVDPSTNGKP